MADTSPTISILANDVGVEKCISVDTNTDLFVEAEEIFNVSVVSTDIPSHIVSVDPDIQFGLIQDITSKTSVPIPLCVVYYIHFPQGLESCLLVQCKASWRMNCRLKCVLCYHTQTCSEI